MKIPLVLLGLVAASSLAIAELMPNSSFETTNEDRPMGWRAFYSPKDVVGAPAVSAGQEGEDTHTGAAALQFQFPEEAGLVQGAWICDPFHGGIKVEPGRYSCVFWVKGENLKEGFHSWVTITGYGDDKKRVDELGRSEYLTTKDLPEGKWTQVSFSFEVPTGGVVQIAPSWIFKTRADSSQNAVSPDFRLLLDDLEIRKN